MVKQKIHCFLIISFLFILLVNTVACTVGERKEETETIEQINKDEFYSLVRIWKSEEYKNTDSSVLLEKGDKILELYPYIEYSKENDELVQKVENICELLREFDKLYSFCGGVENLYTNAVEFGAKISTCSEMLQKLEYAVLSEHKDVKALTNEIIRLNNKLETMKIKLVNILRTEMNAIEVDIDNYRGYATFTQDYLLNVLSVCLFQSIDMEKFVKNFSEIIAENIQIVDENDIAKRVEEYNKYAISVLNNAKYVIYHIRSKKIGENDKKNALYSVLQLDTSVLSSELRVLYNDLVERAKKWGDWSSYKWMETLPKISIKDMK